VLPRATAVVNYEVEHNFPDLGARTMLITARTLTHPDRNSHSMLVSIVDVTEGRAKDAAKDMLFGELRHRMKNVLGVAQSIARQMPTEGRSAEEYRDAFLGRFGALMDAQDLAFSEHDDAGLSGLIARVLEPYRGDPGSVVIEGPDVTLAPRTTMSLGMVLHELATNAVKYGALSVSGGQVHVSWQFEEGTGSLRLNWVERGGPAVTPPASTGYGTQLLRFTTTYNLHGKLEQEYAEGGLRVEMVIPLGKANLSS
ncbi:MAG: sensor histidine kinase, partial [Sphingomonadales bacterium]|nr:sensor histidine kinase [Sphingomonadales bacterium]